MPGLEHSIRGLQQALDSPRRQHMWRWLVRHRLATVKDALAPDRARGGDAWLAARELTLLRDRDALLRRLTELGAEVLDSADAEQVRTELLRTVADLERYRQRLNDLVYDSVSLELGGSE